MTSSVKRSKETLYVRQGLNFRPNYTLQANRTLDFFETRIFREKLVQSIYENTRLFLFKQGVANYDIVNRIEAFVRDHVLIDAVYVDTMRDPVTGILSVKGTDMNLGKHRISNGYSQNMRDRRGKNAVALGRVPENVMIVVFVSNYTPDAGLHNNHAIAAFKHGTTLFCFNPWGEEYLQASVPDDLIWERLRAVYKCNRVVVYTGSNFQKNNTVGACVGLSVDFGAYMYNHLFRHGAFNMFMDYNAFVQQLFNTYIGAFGDFRSGCRVSEVLTRLQANTKKTTNNRNTTGNRIRVVPANQLNLVDTVHRLYNNKPDFSNAMRRARLLQNNVDETARAARNELLVHIRTQDPGFQKVHGNAIHAQLRRYVESGNIAVRNRNAMNLG